MCAQLITKLPVTNKLKTVAGSALHNLCISISQCFKIVKLLIASFSITYSYSFCYSLYHVINPIQNGVQAIAGLIVLI